jgi:ABC-type multidrug transport system fused ATPase/permease subunit
VKTNLSVKHDLALLFRLLLPALRPSLWPILGSLGFTGLVIGADLLQPYCFKQLLDAATVSFQYQLVLISLIALLLLGAVRSILSYWDIFVRSRVGEQLSASYRKRLFEHLLHLPLKTLAHLKSGVVESRIMHDCGVIGRVYVATQLLPLIANLVQALILLVLILWLHWHIGLASLLVFPLGWLLAHRMTQRSHRQVIQLKMVAEEGHEHLREVASCLKEVRAVGMEAEEIRRWDDWLLRYGRCVCRTTTEHQFLRQALRRLIEWMVLCIVYGWGAWQLLHHQISIGSLLALALYVQHFYATFSAILAARAETGEVAAALQAIDELLQLPREWPDQGKRNLGPLQGNLSSEQVHFAYSSGSPTLHAISFTSSPGTTTGIVGPTGSGKSTLIYLCLRFYQPTKGKIMLDGHDIAEIAPHVLRQQIGIVSQDIQLWQRSIRENLLYGLPETVPWDRVLEVCKQTKVHDFVQRLPDGYEMLVGARGMTLSGGEKQRLALAKALLRDSLILLLDEATSALDALTEAALTTMLRELCSQKNRIVVAHRLATVQDAERIIVLDRGRIVEEGAPEDLRQHTGLNAALYRAQQLPDSVRRPWLEPGG